MIVYKVLILQFGIMNLFIGLKFVDIELPISKYVFDDRFLG